MRRPRPAKEGGHSCTPCKPFWRCTPCTSSGELVPCEELLRCVSDIEEEEEMSPCLECTLSVTRAGAQLTDTAVEGTVTATAETEGGSAGNARHGDDGSLHSGGSQRRRRLELSLRTLLSKRLSL